jgi:hypothetical protein
MSRISRAMIFLFLLMGSAVFSVSVSATQVRSDDGNLSGRVATLERRIGGIEEDVAGAGIVLIVIGAMCALWAQNTGRSSWLWFFIGLFGNVFALIAMLVKNGRDIDARSVNDDLEET